MNSELNEYQQWLMSTTTMVVAMAYVPHPQRYRNLTVSSTNSKANAAGPGKKTVEVDEYRPPLGRAETVGRLVAPHSHGKVSRDRYGKSVLWITVDAALAESASYWMMSPNQRNLRKNNVAMLATAKRNGKYLNNNDIWICVFEEHSEMVYLIVNGQHTLAMLAETKLDEDLKVVLDPCNDREEAASRYAVIDRGAKRTQSDANKMLAAAVTNVAEQEALTIIGSNRNKSTAAIGFIHNGLTGSSTHGDDENLSPYDKFEGIIQEPWRVPVIQFYNLLGERDDAALRRRDYERATLWTDFHDVCTGAAFQAVFVVSLHHRPTETVEVTQRLIAYAKGSRRASPTWLKTLYDVIMNRDSHELGFGRGFVQFRTAHALNAAIERADERSEMMRLVSTAKRVKGQAELFRKTWGLASGGAEPPARNRLQINLKAVRERRRHAGEGFKQQMFPFSEANKAN